MRTFTALIPVLLILGFVASSAAAGPGRAIEFEAVYGKTFNPTPDMQLQSEYVFRDEASWCGFWDLISDHASFYPDVSADCPAVDFRRAVVVAVVGFVNGCAGSIQIASAERVGSRRAVDVVVEHFMACPEWLCAQVFFGFVQAAVIARPVGDIEFVHEAVEPQCFEPVP